MQGVIDRTRYQYDDTQFIHQGLGGSLLTMPPGAAGLGQPPASTAQINPLLRTIEIEQQRDIWKLGGGFYLGPD